MTFWGAWVWFSCALGTLPPFYKPDETWMGLDVEASGINFKKIEKQRFFYPPHYTLEGGTTFAVLEDADLKEIRKSCLAAGVGKEEEAFLTLLEKHKWRVPLSSEPTELVPRGDVPYFYFYPGFFGPVMSGACGPQAVELLATNLAKLRLSEIFRHLHGHDFIAHNADKAFHKRIQERAKEFFFSGRNYSQSIPVWDHFETHKIGQPPQSDDVVNELVNYMYQQMITVEHMFLPSLQYCQMMIPRFLDSDITRLYNPTNATSSPKSADDLNFNMGFRPQKFTEFDAERPIGFLIVANVPKDPDPRYGTRQTVLQGFTSEPSSKALAVWLESNEAPAPEEYSEPCFKDGALSVKMSRCKVEDTEIDRRRLFKRTKFFVYTRDEEPLNDHFYEALYEGPVIIQTVDKTLDSSYPNQCQVPWEDFTIRVYEADLQVPDRVYYQIQKNIKARLSEYDGDAVYKMQFLQYYFLDHISYQANNPLQCLNPLTGKTHERQSLVIDDLFANIIGRCCIEQHHSRKNFTYTCLSRRCPNTEYARKIVLPRTPFNVDKSPWNFL